MGTINKEEVPCVFGRNGDGEGYWEGFPQEMGLSGNWELHILERDF